MHRPHHKEPSPTTGPPSAPPVATFSIVAADPDAGEVGVAVASKFFAVGSVVPWLSAGVGAVATQSYANTAFGPRGLELLAEGRPPGEVIQALVGDDPVATRRQLGVVSATGQSATLTGAGCVGWAGGRYGDNYAVQGNILATEEVVEAMETGFLETKGELAARLYAALVAGDRKGGDSRGRQSAALQVARPGGGYGGFNDRYIDVRVDDHQDPLRELGRLVGIAHIHGQWNLAWTAFTDQEHDRALPYMERTAELADDSKSTVLGEVLYDLAIIRAAAGNKPDALVALERALQVNPRLSDVARTDNDLEPLRAERRFVELVGGGE